MDARKAAHQEKRAAKKADKLERRSHFRTLTSAATKEKLKDQPLSAPFRLFNALLCCVLAVACTQWLSLQMFGIVSVIQCGWGYFQQVLDTFEEHRRYSRHGYMIMFCDTVLKVAMTITMYNTMRPDAPGVAGRPIMLSLLLMLMLQWMAITFLGTFGLRNVLFTPDRMHNMRTARVRKR